MEQLEKFDLHGKTKELLEVSFRPDTTQFLLLQKHRVELWDRSHCNVSLYEEMPSPGLVFTEAKWSKDVLVLLSKADNCVEVLVKDFKEFVPDLKQLKRCFISFSPNGSLACIANHRENHPEANEPKIHIIKIPEPQPNETIMKTQQKCIVDEDAFVTIAKQIDFGRRQKDFCFNLYKVCFIHSFGVYYSSHYFFLKRRSLSLIFNCTKTIFYRFTKNSALFTLLHFGKCCGCTYQQKQLTTNDKGTKKSKNKSEEQCLICRSS